MFSSRVNYALALLAAPFVALNLYLGLYGWALLWAVAAGLHMYIGHKKDQL